jgi:hypothetical protein
MKIKLKKSGTNAKQLPHTWIIGPDDGGKVPLEIGEKIHIGGQPDDVWWIVESVERGQSGLPDVLNRNQPEIGN